MIGTFGISERSSKGINEEMGIMKVVCWSASLSMDCKYKLLSFRPVIVIGYDLDTRASEDGLVRGHCFIHTRQ